MNEIEAHRQLTALFFGYIPSKCIDIVGRLGVADQLVDGALPIEEIAHRTKTKAEPLYRVLRLLSGYGVFLEEEGRSFALTPMAELLRRNTPSSFNAFAKLSCDVSWPSIEDLMVALTDDRIPFDHHFGMGLFEYVTEHPELIEQFNDAMLGFSWPATKAILSTLDLSDVETFADIGGGNGHVVINVLKKYPDAKGVLFDLPEVVEQTQVDLSEAGVSDRCAVVGGDFFEGIPVQADTYFLRHILHDWSDEQCSTILTNIAEAGKDGSRILIAESVIGAPNQPDVGKLHDVDMMAVLSGRERTEDEFRALLEAAGYQFSGVIPTGSIVSVVEARVTR